VADHDGLDALVRERWRALVGYGFVLCGGIGDAEDLVSEAVLRTFGRRSRDLAEHAVEAYVRSTMLRLYVDGYRRRRRWFALRPRLARPDRVESTDALTAAQLDVRRALATLPRRERACVVLRYYDDLTVPGIAAELGIAEGSVKRYLSQGLARLEHALHPSDDAAPTPSTSSEGGAR